MKQLITTLFLVSACSAAVDDELPADGGAADDGGPGEMTESATVRFLFTTVRDERGDAIDFSSGEPVHVHAGPEVTLGGSACPDLYKYSYLTSRSAPPFGGETAPNPLRWQVELKNTESLDVAASAYRVRTAGGEPLSEWRPLPLVDAIATIDLVREDIPALGEREGELFIDIRTVDTAGVEAITSACWVHHPLAAPLEVQQARFAIAGLIEMGFAQQSPMSRLFAPGVRVFSQRIVQHTAEPVTAEIDAATPVATFAVRAVDDYVEVPGGATNFLCASDFDGFESDDPMCNEIPPAVNPPDKMTSGALVNAKWTLQVIDEATALPVCTVSGLRATCPLPARAAGDAAISYRVELWMRDGGELAPSPTGPFAEHTLAGATFTGKLISDTPRCTLKADRVFSNGTTATFCKSFVRDVRFHALDQARIMFAPQPFALAVSPASTLPPTAPPHVTTATLTVPATTWDAGDDDLPGPQ